MRLEGGDTLAELFVRATEKSGSLPQVLVLPESSACNDLRWRRDLALPNEVSEAGLGGAEKCGGLAGGESRVHLVVGSARMGFTAKLRLVVGRRRDLPAWNSEPLLA